MFLYDPAGVQPSPLTSQNPAEIAIAPQNIPPPPWDSDIVTRPAEHFALSPRFQNDQGSVVFPPSTVTPDASLLQPLDWAWIGNDSSSTEQSSWDFTGSGVSPHSTWALIGRSEASEEQRDWSEPPLPISKARQTSLDLAGAFGPLVTQEADVREGDLQLSTEPGRKESQMRSHPDTLRPRPGAGVAKAKKKKGKLTEEGKQNAKIMRQVGNCLRCRVYNLGVRNRFTLPHFHLILTFVLSAILEHHARSALLSWRTQDNSLVPVTVIKSLP